MTIQIKYSSGKLKLGVKIQLILGGNKFKKIHLRFLQRLQNII